MRRISEAEKWTCQIRRWDLNGAEEQLSSSVCLLGASCGLRTLLRSVLASQLSCEVGKFGSSVGAQKGSLRESEQLTLGHTAGATVECPQRGLA